MTDEQLIATCSVIQNEIREYVSACEAEIPLQSGTDALSVVHARLCWMRDQRAEHMGVAAQIAAQTAAGLRAKATVLLAAIDHLDPLPELELARSLSRDVLACGAL